MASKEYYERWLQCKEQFSRLLEEDDSLQELAKKNVGLKPQGMAVEVVARVYCKYCELFNKLCDCYDQMGQAQRRPYIRLIIDAITCRIMELKNTLENIEMFQFTYADNAMQQLIIIPQDIEIVCPFFYSFEIREQEKQYIVDQIMAGNRLGDPKPTPSELNLREEKRLEEERIKEEEKMAEIKRKQAMGEEILESEPSIVYTPEQIENMRLEAERNTHINNIQRMERSRTVILSKVHKFNKDADMYLELAGLKAPKAKPEIQNKACKLIQAIYRRFMELKREKDRETKLRIKLGMEIPAYKPPSVKIELENVKNIRRKFRQEYHEKWVKDTIKENSRVLRLRKDDIMEDISVEVREWFLEWYKKVRVFDEYPFKGEGGSILVVRGDTFTIDEFKEWQKVAIKEAKKEPKPKDQIKAEKLAAKAQQKRLEKEFKIREIKRIQDYKKSRLSPKDDPGVYVTKGIQIDPIKDIWFDYQTHWKNIDTPDAELDAKRGHIMQLITEIAYQDANLKLRPIVDDMMRLELSLLKKALKNDYLELGIETLPLTKKRRKPRREKRPKRDRSIPAQMFQQLVDQGIVRKYPRVTLEDFWGDRNYAAADLRAIPIYPSMPKYPPACVGDVREQVRVHCLLALSSNCPNAERSHLLVGPKSAGKRTLVYAIATETNSILIDISPMNVFNKFPGNELKEMFLLINKISRIMQPTIIMVEDADKLFYSKVPKKEKMFNPTRLQRDFFKEIVKPIQQNDKILVLGTASEPWIAKGPLMYNAFPSTIMVPRSDYGSIVFALKQMLSKFHGVQRDFNVHSVAQAIRGYSMSSIIKSVEQTLAPDRIPKLYHKPLEPIELLLGVLAQNGTYTDDCENKWFHEWYLTYCPFGTEYSDLMKIVQTQYLVRFKADEKKKQKKAGGAK